MLKTSVVTALVVSSFGLLACDSKDDTSSTRVQIALTDAPGDGVQAAFVVISEIYLQGKGGRVVLRDTPVTVDLVTLSNSAHVLVDLDVPDGAYSELRFVIDGAWIEVETQTGIEVYATKGFEGEADGLPVHELKTPSWSSSGLKLKLPDGHLVVDGTQRFLIVDFDVAETFRTETGNGAWVMSPVVAVNDIEMTTAIEINARLGLDFAYDGPIVVELYDREGFFEGSLLLLDDDNDGVYTSMFVFVDPAEGPFTARIVTGDGVLLTTVPSLLAINGQSGLTVSTDIELVAIIAE